MAAMKMSRTDDNGVPQHRTALFAGALMTCLCLSIQYWRYCVKAELLASAERHQQNEEQLQQLFIAHEKRQLAGDHVFSPALGPAARPNATNAITAEIHEDVLEFMKGSAIDEQPRKLQTQCDSCWQHWRIHGDGCEHVQDPRYPTCISSTGLPVAYTRNQSCSIEIAENLDGVVQISWWQVGLPNDYLTINGVEWSQGRFHPSYRRNTWQAIPGLSIHWASSNLPTTRLGWRLCLRTSCAAYDCGPRHRLKNDPQVIYCGPFSGPGSGYEPCSPEDLLTCCDPLCEAPQDLGPDYVLPDNCTPGSWYSALECPIGCADDKVLDGHSSPQTCLADGTFSLPTCVARIRTGSGAGPMVIHGPCPRYGHSCFSSTGAFTGYGKFEQCLMVPDWENLLSASDYQIAITYMDIQTGGDWLFHGAWLTVEGFPCDHDRAFCNPASNESDIPTWAAGSSSLARTLGMSARNGKLWWYGGRPFIYPLDNMAWWSDNTTEWFGWMACVQLQCSKMICPSGYRFNCASDGEWCQSHDCSFESDRDLCCLPETQEDADKYGFEIGQAHNISWCLATSTSTTTTTTWGGFKPDIVGHFILQLPAIEVEQSANGTAAGIEALSEVLQASLVQLSGVGEHDVQVQLNMSMNVRPTSHFVFRVEQTDVPLEQLPNEDFLATFNNATAVVEAITHRVMGSSTLSLWGDTTKKYRGFGSNCEDLQPCDETSSTECWAEEFTSQTCAAINQQKVCGAGGTRGPGWSEMFANVGYPESADLISWVASSTNGWVTDECCSCGGGHCSNGHFRIFDGVPVVCIPCRPGTTSIGADDPHDCSVCEPGTFARSYGSDQCSSCPRGQFVDVHGATECDVCPPSTVSATVGGTACTTCPAGQAPSPDQSECVPCLAGYFAPIDSMHECEACPAGQFMDQVGATACELCGMATFTASAGRLNCDPCAAGSYSDTFGVTACYDCPLGQAQALTSQSACVDCEVAYYAGIAGLSECLLCDAGTETFEIGASACSQCSPGFAKAAGELNCSACEAGTYTAEPGLSKCNECLELGQRTNAPEAASACVDCEFGRYGPRSGMTSCMDCELGFFGMQEKMSACEQCDEGLFSNKTGQTECLQCEPGRFAPAKEQFACELCSPGRHAPIAGSFACIACHKGTYANLEGTSVCANCSVGLHNPVEGQTACYTCQKGRYTEEPGKVSCDECELGFYADAEGSSACTPCSSSQEDYWITMRRPTEADPVRPSGIQPWVELFGATSAADCGCRPGSQFEDDMSTCKDCGEGLICLGMGEFEIEEGYAWDGQHSAWNCKYGTPEACPGGMPGTCKPGRDLEEIACGTCMPDSVESKDGSCTKCEGGDLALPIVLVLVLFVGGMVLYCMFDSPNRKRPKLVHLLIIATLGQVVTIIQQVGVISLIRVKWVQPARDALDFVATLAFFDLQDVRAGCAMSLSVPEQYLLRVIIVFIVLAVVGVMHGVSQVAQHRHDWSSRWPSLWCAQGTVILAFMVSIVSTMLSPMQCRRHPNGRQTVSWYPTIVCWEGGDHSTMVAEGTIACLLPLTFLVASCWAIWVYPQKMLQAKVSFFNAWSFLFVRYTPEAYWYGPSMMVRNTLLGSVPVFTSAVSQIMVIEVTMLSSLTLLLYIKPWRVAKANALDAIGHISVLVVCMLAAFFLGEENLNFISVACVILLCIVLSSVVIIVCYCVWRVLRMSQKEFQFFLCHHKLGAGCFCRLLKFQLLRTSGVNRKVFIDSDDLKDLDKLFEVVSHQTETLVAVTSQNLLKRPWCVGEITTAHRSRVSILPLYVMGVEPASQDFVINFIAYVPEIASISQYGIDLGMVQEALTYFVALKRCQLPQEIHDKTLEAICSGLVATNLPENLFTRFSKPKVSAQVVILANMWDFEASATAMILRSLLNPLLQNEDNSLSDVLGIAEPITHAVSKSILICTNGVFTRNVLTALLVCKAKSAKILPVMSVVDFTFPSQKWMDDQEVFTAHPQREEACQLVRAVFSEIAVDFQPSALSGTEGTLRVKAKEIAGRLAAAGSTTVSDSKVSRTSGGGKRRRSSNGQESSSENQRLETTFSSVTQAMSLTQGTSTQAMSLTQGTSASQSIKSKEISVIDADWELGTEIRLAEGTQCD